MNAVPAVPAPMAKAPAAAPPPPLTDRARSERRLAWLLCAPAVIVMLAVTGYPIVYAVFLSLQRYDLRFPAASKFVGLPNYGTCSPRRLVGRRANTVIITVFSVAIELVLGMLLALVMHRAIFGRGVVRAAVLVPYGIVTVVAAFAWRYAVRPPPASCRTARPAAATR